jgi:hypothetical protein
MSDIKLGKPAQGGGGFKNAAHEDHFVIFFLPVAEDIVTANGPTIAARCPWAVCVTCDEVYEDALIFGQYLVADIAASTDDLVSGMLVKGMSQQGRGFWTMEEPSDEANKDAEAWVDSRVKHNPITGKYDVDNSF